MKKKANKNTSKAVESFTLPSEEPTISKQYMTAIELKAMESFADKFDISKLNSELLGLRIKNTELIISNLQHQMDKLKVSFQASLDNEKVCSENSRQNMISLRDKYSIKGAFAFDPISGEIITE